METKEFLDTCKEFIRNYLKGLLPNDTQHVSMDDVKNVWYCKTLQNNKGLFTLQTESNIKSFGYFECTWNSDTKELYLDVYDKVTNKCFYLGKE